MDHDSTESRGLIAVHACFELLCDGREADAMARFQPAIVAEARALLGVNAQMSSVGAAAASDGIGPGAVLGEFTLVRPVGQGGLGRVFEAIEHGVGRHVAVKVMPAVWRADDRPLRPSEARLLAQLEHPGIARLYRADVTELNGRRWFWIAMELVRDARTLTDWAAEQGRSIDERIEAIATVAEAVQHAHGRGVIHRDLKPGNVLVDGDGRPAVIDFGIAGMTEQAPAVTNVLLGTKLEGTLGYVAPESLDPHRPPDVRSDLFALGAMLFEVIGGRPLRPVAGATIAQQLHIVSRPVMVQLPQLTGLARRELERIIRRATAHDPADRYQTAAQFAEDLRRHLRGEPVLTQEQGAVERWRRAIWRHHRLVWSSVAVAAVLASITVLAVRQANRAAEQARHAQLALLSRAISDADRSTIESAATEVLAGPPCLERDVITRLLATGRSGMVPHSCKDWILLGDGSSGIGLFTGERMSDFEPDLLARADGGRIVWRVPQPTTEIGALSVTRDGAFLPIATLRGDFALHDTATGAGIPIPRNGNAESDQAITEVLGNGWVVSAGHTLRRWALDRTATAMADIPLNVGLVRSMKAHPILPTVVAIGGEEGVVVADAATGSVKPIGRPGLRALAVEWTADGASVLAGGRGLERIPLDPGGPSWSARGHGGAVWGLARLDADRVVSAGSDGVVRLWSIGTGTELGQLPLASEKLWSIDVRNGELGVSSQSGAFTIRANEVDRWFGVHAPPVLDVRGSIRVERVADRAIRVAHGDSTRIVETDTPILLAAITADASAVVLALDDGSVRCMELDGPRERWILADLGDGIHEQERHGMRSLSIDDAGRHVLLGRRTAGASLHAMETGLHVWTIKPAWQLESASLAPDGTFACITGREGHVQRVECTDGSVEQVCKPFTQSVPASTISGDGSRLIVGSLDGAVVLFEADSMRELLRVGCSPSPIDRVWIEEDGIHSIDRDRWHRVR